MAIEHIYSERERIISFTKEEVVNIIHLLSAQLAEVGGGGCPSVHLERENEDDYYLSFVIKRDVKKVK